MHRIDGPGATVDHKFTEGDPANAVPATTVTDDWLNTIQEELAAVVEDGGGTLDKNNNGQVLARIKALITAAAGVQPLESARIDVASAATINLTTAAPNTRHINITGTTTIAGFTVAAGRFYIVRFNAALTLTNSASLVTQTGQNVVTKAGDTCFMRATAANVVEITSYVPYGSWNNLMTTDGYQRLPGGLIMQWGRSSATIAAAGGTLNITFPIAFATDVFYSTVQIVSCSPGNGSLMPEVVATTLTNLQIINRDTDSAITQFRWFSIGY